MNKYQGALDRLSNIDLDRVLETIDELKREIKAYE